MPPTEPASTTQGRLLLVSLLAGGAIYLLHGATPFGKAALGMVVVVWALGALNGPRRGTAVVVNILLALVAGVSLAVAERFDPSGMVGAQGVAWLIFGVFVITMIRTLFKLLLGLGALALCVFLIGYALRGGGSNTTLAEQPLDELLRDTTEALVDEERPGDVLQSHLHRWANDAFERYECRLEIWRSQQESAFRHRSGLKMRASQSQQEYWGKIYVELAKHNSPFMTRAMAAYFDLRQEHGLSDLDLAKAVVNSVQSIPYVLIYRDDCAELPRVNPALAKLAAEHGCKGNVSYGLQAPAEFLYDFKGDCDTRTVFLFTVLDKMGYRVAVLNSDRYGHSMLGVALPGVGKYKEYRGQKFYFWETTASGWNMGTLPPDLGNEQDWYVVLAN